MYNYSEKDKKGTTPYTAPRAVIYENKKIKYDEAGQIKAIVDIVTKEEKAERNLKKRLIRTFSILFAIAFLVDFVRMTFFSFTPAKWQKFPNMRVYIARNLENITEPNIGERKYIETICFNLLSFTDSDHCQKTENMKKAGEKYSLLFRSSEEVAAVLGEPILTRATFNESDGIVENENSADSLVQAESSVFTTQLFNAYKKSGTVYYIQVNYYDDTVIDLFLTSSLA